MKFRFITYLNEIYLVVGIGFDDAHQCQEYFEVIPLQPNLFKAVLYDSTLKIPFSQAIEITDKNTLLNLLVLYG